MTSVKERIRLGDLIETFKIVTGHVDISARQFFDRNQNSSTRGHQLKQKIRSKTKIRMKFFSNRVVPAWNRLPQNIVLSKNTNESRTGWMNSGLPQCYPLFSK